MSLALYHRAAFIKILLPIFLLIPD